MDGLQLLNLVEPIKRREIQRFVEAQRRGPNPVNEVAHMKWVADAMELMAPTRLNNDQKKKLVIALYHDLAKDATNDFKEEFDVASAIEFVWDASRNRFGVVLRRQGCLTQCLPCCSDVSVMVQDGQVQVGVEPLTVAAVKEPAPQPV